MILNEETKVESIIRDIKLSEILNTKVSSAYYPLIKHLDSLFSDIKKFKFSDFDYSILYENNDNILFEVHKSKYYDINTEVYINDHVLNKNLIEVFGINKVASIKLVTYYISKITGINEYEIYLFPAKNWTNENIEMNGTKKIYE